MSLADAYNAIIPLKRICPICVWLEQRPEADQKFFAAQAGGNLSRLWKACKAKGLEMEVTSFRRRVQEHHVSS